MAGFFCITRISGTSHKIGRNFSQDLPHLVTRYQASRFLASFYVLFCGHIPLPVGNMPLPKNCPKNPSEVSAFSANCLFMGFPAEGFFCVPKDFEESDSLSQNADEQSVCGEAETSEGKNKCFAMCIYKETGENNRTYQ